MVSSFWKILSVKWHLFGTVWAPYDLWEQGRTQISLGINKVWSEAYLYQVTRLTPKNQYKCFSEKNWYPPHQPNPTPWTPTSAFVSDHIIIQDLGYVDIIYQVWFKDTSIPSEPFNVLLWPWKWSPNHKKLACHNYIYLNKSLWWNTTHWFRNIF